MNQYDQAHDEALLDAWHGGDKRAGATLLTRYHTAIASFFIRKLGPDSDDLVQETFVGLLENIEHFRRAASFRAYLFGIARNKLHRHLRDLIRDRARFDPSETSLKALGLTPTQALAARDQNRLLLAALRMLPLDTQVMIELHYWERLTIKEIAAVFAKSEGAIRVQLHRGRKTLERNMAALAESKRDLEGSLRDLSAWAARLRGEIGEIGEIVDLDDEPVGA